MASDKVTTTLCVLVAIVSTALALPLKTCPAFECTGSNDVFAFEPGKTYTYNLETQTSSVLSGATVAQGKLHLHSEVTLQAVSPCSAILSVKKPAITNGDKKHQGGAIVEGTPVLIGIQNGELVSEFCGNEADSLVSFNVKRAVASLFQVATESKQYTDVFGTCDVQSTVATGADGAAEYTTFRDLNTCKKRESIISSIPSSSYDFNAPVQTAPVLKSSARLEQRLKGKVLDSASAHEEYHFQPYANQGNGAIITVSTNISLVSTTDGASQFAAPAPTSVSVIFETPHGSNHDYSNPKAIQTAVDDACKAIESSSVETAHLVRSLIQVVRQSSTGDLLKAVNSNKAKCGAKVLLDALLNAATGQSVEALVKLAKSKVFTDLDQLYASLAFNRHPTLSSIKAITTLIEKGSPPRELVLGAGAFVGKYNELHGTEGGKEIDTLLERLARPLENCQAKTHEQEDKILTALKGLHNAHYIPDTVADKLKECVSRKSSTRVRAAVLDAIQSDAANKKLKPTVLEILTDREEDSELRIKAYLVAATCPCGAVFETVSTLLEKEPINQVGSFIATHLRNLRASTNPDKANAKKILGSIKVPSGKFKYDYRRFSTNNELSFSLGKDGLAASAESNVIFSQNSFLPRSTDLNLTANVFGHSFNLLEVGLRAENLEHILEAYFGPKGYFNTRTADSIVTTSNDTVNTLAQKIKDRATQSIRNRRSVDRSSLEKMSAKVQLEDDDKINVDLYIKLFGYELAFYSYYGNPNEFSPAGIVDKIFDRVDNTIQKAKDFDFNCGKNLQLFDTELAYPTFSGFPLKLSSIGTAAVKVELKTKFDLPSIVKDPKNTDITFKFIPSATIEVASEFFVDFYVASAGLKHAATIHSSNGVDLNVKVQSGKGFDVNIGTPLAQQELIHVKSELFSVSRDKGLAPVQTELGFNIPRKQFHGCFDQLSPFLGVTFCGNIEFPNEGVPKKNPFFPLDGPADFYLTVKKEDATLTAYKVSALYHDDVADVKGWSLQFSTPGASNERLVRFFFTATRKAPNQEYKLEFTTPIKSGYASLLIIEEKQKELALDATLKLDAEEYKAKIALKVLESTDTTATYRPELTYSGPGSDGSSNQYSVAGTIKSEKFPDGGKISFTDVALTIPKNKYQVDGHLQFTANKGYNVDIVAKYNNLAESIILKSAYEHALDDKNVAKSRHFDIEFKMSKYADTAFAVIYDAKREEYLFDNKVKIFHGPDLKSETNCITISHFFKGEKTGEKFTAVSTKNQISYPAFNIFFHFDSDVVYAKSFSYVLEGGVDKQKVTSELSLKVGIPGPQQDPKDPGGFELAFKAGAAGQTVSFNAARHIQSADTSKIELSGELQPKGHVIKIDSDVVHRFQKNDLKLKSTSVVSITGFPDTFTVSTGVQSTPQQGEGFFTFTKGSDDLLRVKGETKHGDVETGRFEVFLKDYLDGSGTFSHTKGKNEGALDATLVATKLNRKVTVTGKLSQGAKPTIRDLSVVVLLDADKDPNNKVTVDTSIDLLKDGRSYDTKTKVVVVDNVFQLNLKGVVANRTPLDNGVMGKFDGTLELPSKQVISTYWDLVQLQESEGKGVRTLIKFDDGKENKLKYSGKSSRADGFSVPTFNLDTTLELSAAQKSLGFHYNVQNNDNSGKKSATHKIDVTGNVIPQEFHSTFTADLDDTPTYKLHANYGQKVVVDTETSFNFKDRKDQSVSIAFNLKSDFKGYEDIKYTSSYKGGFGDHAEFGKGDARDHLEINNARVYDINVIWDYVHTDTNCKGTAKVSSLLGAEEKDPRVLTISHEYNGPTTFKVDSNTARKFVGSVGLEQGSTSFLIKANGETPGDGTNSGKFGIELDSPIENYEKIALNVDHQSKNGGKLLEVNADTQFGKGEDRHYQIAGKVDLSEVSRVFDVQITKSDKTAVFKSHAAYQRPSSNEIQGQLNINVGGAKPRNLAVDGVAKFPGGFDEFDVVINLDSEDMKLNKVRLHLENKGTGKGRKISISAKSAEKTYIEGSTTYQKKEDGKATVYEGKGDVEVNGEKYSSDFSLSHRILQKAKDSETGFDVSLKAGLTGKDKKTLESQFLLTDKALRAFTKFCGDKCSLVDVANTIKITDTTELHIENKINFDIEHTPNVIALNIASTLHRIGLQISHKVEVTVGKDAKATYYKYELFIKDRTGGLYLVTPKRTMAIDSLYSVPEQGKKDGSQSYKGEVTVYFDKVNQPDQKLTLLSSFDVNKAKDGTVYSSDLKISHPLIGKDLIIKGKTLIGSGQVLLDTSLLLDVFAKRGQAISFKLLNEKVPITDGYNMTSTLTVSSKGQNLDVTTVSHFVATKNEVGFGSTITCKHDKTVKETSILFAANIDSLLIFVRSPSCEILRVHGDCKRETGLPPKSNFFLTFLETLAVEGEILGYQSLKYQAYDKNQPDVRTVYTGAFEVDKEILLQAEHLSGGNAANLFRLRVALDSEHFLQTEQSLDADQLKVALERLQSLAKSSSERLTSCVVENYKLAESRAKVIYEGLKTAQPNLQPLINRCKEQFEALQNELRADPTINEVIDIIKNLVGGISASVTKFLEKFTEYFSKVATAFKEWAAKFSELISKLTPVVTEALGNISKSFASFTTTFLEIFSKAVGKILEALKANSAEIQKVFGLFAEFVKESSVNLREIANEVRKLIEELAKTLIKQIEVQPVFDTFKVKYGEFYKMFLERFEGVFAEISETLKEILPNQELKELAEAFTNYINKKFRGEAVDDIKEIKTLTEKLIKAFTALVNLPEATGIPGLQGLNLDNVLKFSVTPVSFDSLTSLPAFASLRVSLVELLSSSDLPSAADLFFTYTVPRHFDDAVPPHRAFALISGSKHFYTFDGDHYTLKGDCQYLLAKDFDDGNFSLTVDLAGNQLRSIAYIDSHDTVEIKADHSVLLNGQATELPVHQNDVSIFRTLHTVNVKSKFGVEVVCDLDYDLCTFAINGYYFGKTRGLLGTITNEKYDDWTLPNGKIATTVSQFSNAYMLSDSCQNQTPVEHVHVSNSECVAAFSRPAPFGECFGFVDPTPYRQGCEDAISDATTPEQKSAAICDAAEAYVAKCRDTTFLQPNIPQNCGHCTLGGKQVEVGQSASVKAPTGKADIVLLVEQTAENEETFKELIPALSTQLKEDLAKQGVSDVNAVLIGYGGPGQKYPSFYTTDGKFAFDGTAPKQLRFGGQVAETAGGISTHPILVFLNRAKEYSALELGLTPLAQAFRQVIEFPFRPDASKAVLLLRNSECHKSKLPVSLQQLTFLQARAFFKDRGITVALFQPIDITTSAEKKVIGFDSENALTYTKKGFDPAGRADVTYEDNCSPYIETVKPVVFSTKVFLELKGGQRKQFVQSASNRLSTLLAVETSQTCDCTLHEGLHAQPKCSVTSTKLKGKKN